MKKIILLVILTLSITTAAFASETPPIGGFNNGLGYVDQMKHNLNQGFDEITSSPKRIKPSYEETEITTWQLPGSDKGQGFLLSIINVSDSVVRGMWRILVSPFPVIQKAQP